MGVMTRVERGPPELANRGYQVLFRPNESNRCPGCGNAQWYVGRVSAECFFCGTALPLADAKWGGDGLSHRFPHTTIASAAGASERRSNARRPVRGRAVHLLIDGSPQAFALHNVSAGGARIEDPNGLISAGRIELVSTAGEIVPAEVRWTADGAAGLQFARRLPIDAFHPEG
ncbi:MAG: PilZ domain-containing protein [Allosphingosinicella sp.]|uniref:PilZ domain-containing protein n=1 Tax=Allosphingosinicella sp. TaxID=2823234 RepID=UPI003960D6EC